MSAESTAVALIVVDLQQSTLANARAFVDPDWLERAASLVDAFHERGLPVVIATALGTPPGRTTYAPGGRDFARCGRSAPAITTTDTDIVVSRRGLSVFAGSDLAERLSGAGVTDLVIVGVATSYGVESTARAAYDLGFSVTVVADAVADVAASSHERALTAILPSWPD